MVCIGYTQRARLLSDLATECCRHVVAKLLSNQARGVQPACTMTRAGHSASVCVHVFPIVAD